MPYLSIETNINIEPSAQAALLQTASTTISRMLSKPESYVMVSLHAGKTMQFSGSTEPCLYAELKSLGLPESECARFSETLCTLFSQELGLATNRIYIEFSNPARHMWGFDNRTF
jgi:phenylpyruvate tautomerase